MKAFLTAREENYGGGGRIVDSGGAELAHRCQGVFSAAECRVGVENVRVYVFFCIGFVVWKPGKVFNTC